MAKEKEQVESYADAGRGVGLRSTLVELSRVVWPTRQELFRMTGVVVGTVIGIALFIGAVDGVLFYGQNFLYGTK